VGGHEDSHDPGPFTLDPIWTRKARLPDAPKSQPQGRASGSISIYFKQYEKCKEENSNYPISHLSKLIAILVFGLQIL
jgi:hypothetical protein